MKTKTISSSLVIIFLLFIACFAFIRLEGKSFATGRSAQTGNSISGFVYGLQRQPVGDVDVELLDEFSRIITRTRTTGSGRYAFYNVRSGRLQVRVLTGNTGYQEQVQEVEIINLQVATSSGGLRTTAIEHAQKDFYLKPRKSESGNNITGTIFVQEIPNQARKAYKKATAALENKKSEEALVSLKEALNIFPDYYLALESLGSEYIKLGKYEEAQTLLIRATQINPRAHQSWYGLSYSQYSLKRFSDALNAVKKAIELEPISINALLLSAMISKEIGLFNDAEVQLKRADELGKGKISEIHWQLAKLYADKFKRFREAADELEIYLKLEPNVPNAEQIRRLIASFRQRADNQK